MTIEAFINRTLAAAGDLAGDAVRGAAKTAAELQAFVDEVAQVAYDKVLAKTGDEELAAEVKREIKDRAY